MTPAQARHTYSADIVDLAEDLADATTAITAAVVAGNVTAFIRDTYDETCARVAEHDRSVTVEYLAWEFQREAAA